MKKSAYVGRAAIKPGHFVPIAGQKKRCLQKNVFTLRRVSKDEVWHILKITICFIPPNQISNRVKMQIIPRCTTWNGTTAQNYITQSFKPEHNQRAI